jgi:hypothetical protein
VTLRDSTWLHIIFVISYDFMWYHVIPHNSAWLCTTPRDFIWLYLTLCDFAWLSILDPFLTEIHVGTHWTVGSCRRLLWAFTNPPVYWRQTRKVKETSSIFASCPHNLPNFHFWIYKIISALVVQCVEMQARGWPGECKIDSQCGLFLIYVIENDFHYISIVISVFQ